MSAPCVFCGIVAGESPSYVVAEDSGALAILDVNPLVRGHTLVLPKRHAVDIFDGGGDVLTSIERVARMLANRLGATGINLLQSSGSVAGQEVFHLHVHILPRWQGDPIARGFGLLRLARGVRRVVPRLRDAPDLGALHATLTG